MVRNKLNINNKYIRGAIPALLIHCSIGSVYAWSLFVNPICNHIQAKPQSVQFAFSLAIFFLGMSAAFAGNIVERNIHKSSLISAICFCGGLLLTALAIKLKSLFLIYIGYGCLMGIGLGVGYLTPIKALMLWFEDHKGVATGIAIMGFGFASTIASPIITILLSHFSLSLSFVMLGLIYFIPMIIAHLFIKKPTWYAELQNKSDFKTLAMLKDKQFLKIWMFIFLNITCGLALIGVASPLLSEMKLSSSAIAMTVSIMGIFNGLGRFVFSAISDKLKDRRMIYLIIFGLSMITTILSMIYKNTAMVLAALLIISSTYGAGFSNLPTLLSDRYGMKNISKIHGVSLSAWAIAGLCGNQISETIKNITGEYINIFSILCAMYIIGFLFVLILKKTNCSKS